jgi:hypothetical protein
VVQRIMRAGFLTRWRSGCECVPSLMTTTRAYHRRYRGDDLYNGNASSSSGPPLPMCARRYGIPTRKPYPAPGILDTIMLKKFHFPSYGISSS